MEILFEKASAVDAEKMLEVQIRAFHDDARLYPEVGLGGPPDYDSLETMLKEIETSLCHKILVDGEIAGGIIAWDEGEGIYHLHILVIDPDYHNLGIGTKAMQFFEASYPAKKWTLDTPSYAIRNQHFYEKLGYIKVGEVAESEEITLFSYEKTKPNPA